MPLKRPPPFFSKTPFQNRIALNIEAAVASETAASIFKTQFQNGASLKIEVAVASETIASIFRTPFQSGASLKIEAALYSERPPRFSRPRARTEPLEETLTNYGGHINPLRGAH